MTLFLAMNLGFAWGAGAASPYPPVQGSHGVQGVRVQGLGVQGSGVQGPPP